MDREIDQGSTAATVVGEKGGKTGGVGLENLGKEDICEEVLMGRIQSDVAVGMVLNFRFPMRVGLVPRHLIIISSSAGRSMVKGAIVGEGRRAVSRDGISMRGRQGGWGMGK